jgi:two-component system, LuxR family, response regulator FixJ
MVDRIHVIDSDARRRAQVSRELSIWNMHAEIYEDLEEFHQMNPSDGFVFTVEAQDISDTADLIQSIRLNGSSLPVVVYAEQPAIENVVSAMRSGALDYVRWPFDARRLDSAFQRLNSDGNRMRQREQLRSAAATRISRLTGREREVLVRLVQGMSNKQTALALQISPRTVEIHRGNMMTKLNARSAADAVRVALYAGLDEDFRFAA